MSDIQLESSGSYESQCSKSGDSLEVDKNSEMVRAPESTHSTQLCWLKLVRDRRWSTLQKRQLLDVIGSPEAVYEMPFNESLKMIGGRQLPKKSKRAVQLDADLQRDLEWLDKPSHSMITFSDPRYPLLLREIADPPIALFSIGDVALLLEPKVAIVGSRRPTPVGAKVAQKIACELAELGLIVTSGMALGIDGLAHQAALQVGEPTIAVMGCGLDTIYPSRNRQLFEQISQFGLILSEYPLGVPVSKYTFPKRNRIVSGLSYGVVIVEAAERSGTLITARLAAEQDRELMVVPGSSVSTQYKGSHRLLQQGASLVTSSLDVVDNLSGELHNELRLRQALDAEAADCSGASLMTNASANAGQCVMPADNLHNEKALLEFISVESTVVDSIILESGLTAAEVSSMLLILEVQGLVAVADDGGYLNLS